MTDEQLVLRTRQGDQVAFSELVSRYLAMVQALCYSRVGVFSEVEDISQESFLRAFRQIKNLREPKKFKSWLAGIVTHVCLDWIRDMSRRRSQPSLEDVGAVAFSSQVAEPQIQAMQALLKELPDPLKDVIVLKYYDQRSYQEMADILGISKPLVNARLTQARKLLKEKWGDQSHEL